MKIYWHYTTGDCVAGIRESREIRPATAYIPANEKPVVWFTQSSIWDNTASKRLVNPVSGDSRVMTLAEMNDNCGGIFRIQVDNSVLIPWPALASAANITLRWRKMLEESARAMGSVPGLWAGHIGPIDAEKIVSIERIDPRTGTRATTSG